MSVERPILKYLNYKEGNEADDVRAGRNKFVAGTDLAGAAGMLTTIEDSLIRARNADLAAYEASCLEETNEVEAEIAQLDRRVNEDRPGQAADDVHENRLQVVEAEFARREQIQESEIKDLNGRWEAIYANQGRLPRYWGRLAYVLVLAILAVFEVPVNRLSFELVFGENLLFSYATALFCGMLLMFLAHCAGSIMRRFRYAAEEAEGPLTQLAWLVVIVPFMIAVCIGLAYLRQGYIDFVLAEAAGPTTQQLLEGGNLDQAAEQVFGNELKLQGYIFLVVNLVIALAGVLAAFWAHDPHPDFERTDRELRRAKARAGSTKLRHGRKDAEAARLRAQIRNKAASDADTARERIDALRKSIDDNSSVRAKNINVVREVTVRRILAHRLGFQRGAAEHGLQRIPERDIPV